MIIFGLEVAASTGWQSTIRKSTVDVECAATDHGLPKENVGNKRRKMMRRRLMSRSATVRSRSSNGLRSRWLNPSLIFFAP